MKFDAILFDLDGTLVDTVALWQESYLGALREHGVDMDVETFMEVSYIKNRKAALILQDHGITDEKTVQAFIQKRDEIHCEKLREKGMWLPGAQEALDTLKERAPLGLITGSWRHFVDALDECMGLSEYFSTIVTATEMERMKPDPNGLFIAAKELNVDPTRCIYIGDMPFDIEAANAAMMTSCLLWGNHTPPGTERDAKIVCKDFDELISRLT